MGLRIGSSDPSPRSGTPSTSPPRCAKLHLRRTHRLRGLLVRLVAALITAISCRPSSLLTVWQLDRRDDGAQPSAQAASPCACTICVFPTTYGGGARTPRTGRSARAREMLTCAPQMSWRRADSPLYRNAVGDDMLDIESGRVPGSNPRSARCTYGRVIYVIIPRATTNRSAARARRSRSARTSLRP